MAFIRPGLIPAWVPVHAVCLWAPELQALLLPVVLALCDSRFALWRRPKRTHGSDVLSPGSLSTPGAVQAAAHAAQAAAVAQAAAQIAAGRIGKDNLKSVERNFYLKNKIESKRKKQTKNALITEPQNF